MAEVVGALAPTGSTGRRGLFLSLIMSALIIGLFAVQAIDLFGTDMEHGQALVADVAALAGAKYAEAI